MGTRYRSPEITLQFLPKSQMTLDVYLINMDGATDRLDAMVQKLADRDLEFTRVPGVNGRAISFPIKEFSELSYKLLHGRRTTPAEVGCYLSHVECARRLLAGHADLALILEDDVSFEPDFLDSLDCAAMHPTDWDILRLTTVNRGRKFRFRELENGRALALALTREKGAGAYVINREGARWIVNRLIPMRLAYDIAFDLEYLDGLKAAFVDPQPASQYSEHETQIQSNMQQYKLPRWRYLTVLPYRAYLEISRFFSRGFQLLKNRFF
jgi:glycosyl transferase family 25